MSEQNTFSLSTILNTHQLQPQLYQHMIHQIKSPLQQQSFDMTQDDSRSFHKIPKRPNIPPAPTKTSYYPHQDQFSRTYDSVFTDLQQSRNYQQDPIIDQAILSVVSPLQCEVNMKKQEPSGPAIWCNRQVDKILKVQDVDGEFEIPYRNSNYKRKPIFQKKQIKKQQKESVFRVKPEKSIEEAKQYLKNSGQYDLAAFIELMQLIEKELIQIDNQKSQMQSKLSMIYEKLSVETNYASQVTQSNDTHSRILRRLHSRNSGEVVRKVLGRNNKKELEGEKHLQKLFTRLNNIEVIITQFINRQNSLGQLQSVYQYLSKNYEKEDTFVRQLEHFYHSLGIFIETKGLELIWEHCQEKKLSKVQFIESLSLNCYIVREDNVFEQQLRLKGFVKNLE